ncbi:MAG: phasin family protein [Alphaproteobacteria bacterium]|nr:phasin family protein [Alphaproteobacteria bacterium]
MSKIPNPFLETDFSKLFDMPKFVGDFKVPNVDVDALMVAHRKNLEALTSANQAAFEGLQSLARRQAELVRQNFEDTANLVNSLVSQQTPEEKVAKQAEVTKVSLERSVANLKELTDLAAKTNYQAIEFISNRISEGLEELRSLVKNRAS